jgi:hypothetical protein
VTNISVHGNPITVISRPLVSSKQLHDNETRFEMPRQESYFRQVTNGVVIEVLKTYDRSYAHEVFRGMNDEALKVLATSLELGKNYAAWDIPESDAADYEDFLWEETCEAAREDVRQDPNLYSFFVVSKTISGKTEDLYVSPDWPSAEEFAKKRLAPVQGSEL